MEFKNSSIVTLMKNITSTLSLGDSLQKIMSSLLVGLLLFGFNQNLIANNTADLGVIVVSDPSYTTCETSLNGELEAIAFNGQAPYTYAWSNGATGAVITGLGIGTYTVTVTDANGEEAVESGEVSLHPEGVWIDINSSAACSGSGNGTAEAVATLGTEPYSFLWSDGQTGAVATGLAEGFYTVTATDAFGCENTATVQITSGDDLELFVTSNYETCIGSEDAKSTVNVFNGEEPFTYEWSDGQTTQIATNLGAGTYGVTVTDANGCSQSATTEVELSPEGLWIMLSATDAACGEDDGTIHVGVMTGVAPYDYEWSDASIGNTADPVNLSAGIYSVTVTDSNGCTASEEIVVESSDQVSVTTTSSDATCDEGGSASVIINSGQEPYNILWSNDANTTNVNDLAPGTYTVEVSDANGCFGMATVFISDDCETCEVEAGSLSGGNDICLNGTATLTATPDGNSVVPAGYETIYVLTSGSGLIIQGVNSSPTFDVDVASIYTIHTLIYDPNTLDLSTVNVGVTTGFDVNGLLIQGGGDICAGLDVAGTSFVVENGFDVSIDPQSTTVCQGSSVQLTTNANGGSFTYQWSATGGNFDDAGSANPTFTMMMPGTYTISVEVTASNGCSATSSTTVTVAPELQINIAPQNDLLCGGGSIDFSVTGGTGNLTYSWVASGGNFSNGSISNPTWTMMMPGTYEITVNVEDDNGCTASASTTATIANPITNCSAAVTSSYLEGVDISTLGGSDGSASASASGGTAPLTYAWSNGDTGANIDGLSAGTYTVDITDANGCSCQASVTLEDPAKLGNYVWEDLNKDGLQDDNEPGIAGVKVTLTGTAANGLEIMRMMETDENGMYMFNGLLPGTYKVTFETPSGFVPTEQNAGNDELDSDADPIMGMSQMVTLGAGEYNPTIDAGFYTCTNVGDYVWFDENHDGIQDADEDAVEGVQVQLLRAGFDGIFCTDDDVVVMEQTTDANGNYLFECVPEGEYVVSFMNLPEAWIFTDSNAGDDTLDSDVDPTTGKTAPFTVSTGDPDNLTLDAGIRPICDNFGDGGEIITSSDPICAGDNGHGIFNVQFPTGGSGPIEYLWMYSTEGGPFDPATYTMIPNSNTADYSPGPLFQTTWFIRCSRRLDCPDYVETNYVVINVEECNGPGTNLIGGITLEQTVELNWNMGIENEDYTFTIEKSYDGERWFEISTQNGKRNADGNNKYTDKDAKPKEGMNYYRLRIEGDDTGISYSNTVALELSDMLLVDVFPNPFYKYLTITPKQPLEDEAIVEVFNASGQLVFTQTYPKDSELIELQLDLTNDFSQMVLRVRYLSSGKYMTMPLIHKNVK